jgi:hypothetical protein
MQRYTIFFINVNAPHVSGGLLAATASVGELEQLTHASGSSKEA